MRSSKTYKLHYGKGSRDMIRLESQYKVLKRTKVKNSKDNTLLKKRKRNFNYLLKSIRNKRNRYLKVNKKNKAQYYEAQGYLYGSRTRKRYRVFKV